MRNAVSLSDLHRDHDLEDLPEFIILELAVNAYGEVNLAHRLYHRFDLGRLLGRDSFEKILLLRLLLALRCHLTLLFVRVFHSIDLRIRGQVVLPLSVQDISHPHVVLDE